MSALWSGPPCLAPCDDNKRDSMVIDTQWISCTFLRTHNPFVILEGVSVIIYTWMNISCVCWMGLNNQLQLQMPPNCFYFHTGPTHFSISNINVMIRCGCTVSVWCRMFFQKHTGEVIVCFLFFFLKTKKTKTKLQFPSLCIYNVTSDQEYVCDS